MNSIINLIWDLFSYSNYKEISFSLKSLKNDGVAKNKLLNIKIGRMQVTIVP